MKPEIKITTKMLITLFMLGCSAEVDIKSKPNISTELRTKLEKAYYEGQKDAIEGDIRIKKMPEGNYVWIKSPWDNAPVGSDYKTPVFIPPFDFDTVSMEFEKPKSENHW